MISKTKVLKSAHLENFPRTGKIWKKKVSQKKIFTYFEIRNKTIIPYKVKQTRFKLN